MKRLYLFLLTISMAISAQEAQAQNAVRDSIINQILYPQEKMPFSAIGTQERLMQNAFQDSIYNQLDYFPQEKIHLHTDRNVYVPGEKIWLKAYVVDAFSHLWPTHSQYVYVELINSSDSLVHRVMISRDENGLFHGNLFLSEFVKEGDYTLRAFTRYMENMGDDYFFSKPIRIGNIGVTSTQPDRRQPILDYDVSFFPEGGNLTEGVFNRVAFKALNRQGASEFITGEIVDATGTAITKVSTVFAGMGSFNCLPAAGETYYLVCRSNSGQEKRFRLPDAKKTFSITANSLKNRHNVQLIKSPDMPEQPLYLLVHCKGDVLYFASWNYQNNAVSFSTEAFPSGVIQLLLLDGQMNPISERLIFNKSDDQATLAFIPDKPYYQKRDLITAEIQVTDAEGAPLAGHVSVAVTDDRDIAVDTLSTISSSLLLSSELRGYIESPGYYLQDHANAVMALDHLMLTHGWRRYEIAEAFKGNYSRPDTGYEIAKTVTGQVKSLSTGRPEPNCEVSFVTNEGNLGQTTTDSAGFFHFQLHYPDSVKFFFQALSQRRGDRVELVIEQEQFIQPQHAAASLLFSHSGRSEESPATGVTSDFMQKAEQRAQYDEDMKLIQLSEVTVTANRIAKKDEVRLQYWFNALSNFTLYREDIEKRNTTNVLTLFYNIPGVFINKTFDWISIDGSTDFLVLIDGMIVEKQPNPSVPPLSPFEWVNVVDIESIDIFKAGQAAAFGLRGAAAVVSITTRRGEDRPSDPKFNNASYTPAGYQSPVEFYAPKYDTQWARNLNVPDFRTTLHWKPDIMVSDDGKASFEFYASDFPTTYSVVIEGISDDGHIIRQVEAIEVR